jgi:hypothetical protein
MAQGSRRGEKRQPALDAIGLDPGLKRCDWCHGTDGPLPWGDHRQVADEERLIGIQGEGQPKAPLAGVGKGLVVVAGEQ